MIDFLHKLREEELNIVFNLKDVDYKDKDLLEIGAGTGFQLSLLASKFKSVIGIDIEDSNYAAHRSEKVITYDGKNIPFGENKFDIIFSSNVLEHISHLDLIENEFKRVLKPGGICIHILPTHNWKFWSTITHYIGFIPKLLLKKFSKKSYFLTEEPGCNEIAKKRSIWIKISNILFPERHGERGNRFTEIFFFHPNWWNNHFKQNNWEIIDQHPTNFFYTGNSFLGKRLSINRRRKISHFIGSACHIYILKNR
jgi:SAM-dependent methyltransferase